jgi:hypothetical protein
MTETTPLEARLLTLVAADPRWPAGLKRTARSGDGHIRWGHRQSRGTRAAREHEASYDASGDPAASQRMPPLHEVPPPEEPFQAHLPLPLGTGPEPPRDRPGRVPLPDEPTMDVGILAEVPDLALLLTDLREVDRLVARSITQLALLQETGLAERVTGVGLDTWMSLVARRTGADIRMLRTTVKVLGRVPSLREAFARNEVSWSQVRSVVLAVHRLPRHLDDRIDAAVAEGLAGAVGAQPDDVTRTIRWMLSSLEPTQTADDQSAAEVAEFLAMQPRLDGTGGTFHGDAGPVNFALLDALLNGGRQPTGKPARDGFAGDPIERPHGAAMREAGKARLDRLISLLERAATQGPNDAPATVPPPTEPRTDGTTATDGTVATGRTAATGRTGAGHGSAPAHPPAPGPDVAAPAHPRAPGPDVGGTQARGTTDPVKAPGARDRLRPLLVLRADLDTLLDRDQTPASLLTTLLGGHVRVTAATARRLIDERGADLRTVIIDDHGSVVGVGRRRRLAPDWMRETLLALHDTCSAPGCDTAARSSQVDHATPWFPARPDDPFGRTDIDEVAPLCRRDNRAKEEDGWRAEQLADGSRRWTHERSGLTTRTLPAVWRDPPPPGPDPPQRVAGRHGSQPPPAHPARSPDGPHRFDEREQ